MATRCKTCENKLSANKAGTRSFTQYKNALDSGQHWGKTNLKYYFYSTSDGPVVQDGEGESIRNWTETQKNNWRTAISEWDKHCGLTLTETTDINEQDIKLYLIDDNSYPYLGHAYFPGSVFKGQNYCSYNNATDKNFTVGSYDYITMVHELGHTLGLAHPHDTGGTSTVFPGVSNSANTGTNQQNQTAYTVMSYNDLNSPITPNNVQSYGFIKGPMAYDISVIQQLYPGGDSQNTGNSSHILPSNNTTGTVYETIVDSTGTDTIDGSNAGTNKVFINMNPHSVDGDSGGRDGWVSKISGVDGGIVVANDTTIENAIAGEGNDKIVGNDADNAIQGGGGNDAFVASNGSDLIYGGNGIDRVYFPGNIGFYSIIKYGTRRFVIYGIGAYGNIVGKTDVRQMERL
tara:strand:- start:11932 stop:13140 length:1209 start_codon:yes stop_codon:yes gene_type:complete